MIDIHHLVHREHTTDIVTHPIVRVSPTRRIGLPSPVLLTEALCAHEGTRSLDFILGRHLSSAREYIRRLSRGLTRCSVLVSLSHSAFYHTPLCLQSTTRLSRFISMALVAHDEALSAVSTNGPDDTVVEVYVLSSHITSGRYLTRNLMQNPSQASDGGRRGCIA